MESGRDWAGLNPDLLVEIAARVPLVEDGEQLGPGSKDKFKPPRLRVPLLMLPGKSDDDGNDERAFYSLSRRKICMRLAIPEITSKCCSGVGFGWLMTSASSGDVSLLNPFSGAKIELPNEQMSHDKFDCIGNAALSADPYRTSDFVLVASFVGRICLGFWRLGDEVWNEIKPSGDVFPWFTNVVCYKEKFYASDHLASAIWVWDPSGLPNHANAEIACEVGVPSFRTCNIELVESPSNGGLLLITSHCEDGRSVVQIRRIDVMKREWELIAGLGNDAVFVGGMASLSVDASAFPDDIEPNRIYLATFGSISPGDIGYSDGEGDEGKKMGKKMGIYNVEDGSTEWLAVDDEPLNHIDPPVWIAPSF